jgi:DNA-binding XRE family transcriptional regulator
METKPSKRGYILKAFYGDSGSKKMMVLHRVIGRAFLPNPLNLPEINHKNGIKTDNRVENLEWCSRSHNIKHCYETTDRRRNRGELSPTCIIKDAEIKEVRRLLKRGATQDFVARKFGVKQCTISDINTGRRRAYN